VFIPVSTDYRNKIAQETSELWLKTKCRVFMAHCVDYSDVISSGSGGGGHSPLGPLKIHRTGPLDTFPALKISLSPSPRCAGQHMVWITDQAGRRVSWMTR